MLSSKNSAIDDCESVKKHASLAPSLSDEDSGTVSTTTTTTTPPAETVAKAKLQDNNIPSSGPSPENGHSAAEVRSAPKMAETWSEMLKVCPFLKNLS